MSPRAIAGGPIAFLHKDLRKFQRRLRSLPLRLDVHTVWHVVNALAFVVLFCLLGRPAFYSPAVDGFSTGMRFIDTLPLSHLFDNPLFLVHAFRYVGLYLPWRVQYFEFAPLFNAIFMAALLFPLVRAPMRGKAVASPLRVVLFYLPCLLSMRAVMATIGIGYLFIIFSGARRARLLFALSALGANYSSASVLLWLIACLGNRGKVRALGYTGIIVSLLMAFSFSASLFVKLPYFKEMGLQFELHDQIDYTGGRYDSPLKKYLIEIFEISDSEDMEQQPWLVKSLFIIESVVDNNTIVISLLTGNYTRAAAYMLLFAMYLSCLRLSAGREEYDRLFFRFFIFCFLVFLMEGLGVLALISPMVLFLSEHAWPKKKIHDAIWSDGYFEAALAGDR